MLPVHSLPVRSVPTAHEPLDSAPDPPSDSLYGGMDGVTMRERKLGIHPSQAVAELVIYRGLAPRSAASDWHSVSKNRGAH